MFGDYCEIVKWMYVGCVVLLCELYGEGGGFVVGCVVLYYVCVEFVIMVGFYVWCVEWYDDCDVYV